MTRTPFILALPLALAACAAAPSAPDASVASTSAPALDCRQLDAEINAARDAQRAAAEKQQDAWKVVVPFAVAARYASAKSAAEEAEQRLGDATSRFERQGCAANR